MKSSSLSISDDDGGAGRQNMHSAAIHKLFQAVEAVVDPEHPVLYCMCISVSHHALSATEIVQSFGRKNEKLVV
ncbi:hypothetical protein ACLB2K_057353 [Fragaria x ananassa]